jgi:hypothetical protein
MKYLICFFVGLPFLIRIRNSCVRIFHRFLNQRKGMGLLEYQAMPSLRDIAHYGVLCSNRSAPVDRGASGVVRQRRRHGPSIAYKITPCWVTLLQL